ncbi:MAG TPA: MaoC/PaaZ C-terminal domain-containing protein [Candidatus Limnocylindrales bacterium]|nr:MaoC/PaaZ C-terminal domain-containing protein [Candidatus Limnocylindrales bacterium]
MMTGQAITFESVEVGDHLPSVRKTITVEQIRGYAEASGDHNPIHLDEAFARAAGLPGVIAHGMLTMAFVNQMVTDWLGDRRRLRALRGRFAGMVVPGDQITCEGAVVGKDEERRRLSIRVSARNQRDEPVFTKGIAEAEF